ncbi:MAG TPA: chaperone modulator CbpM [Kofleriaceae bacterium]
MKFTYQQLVELVDGDHELVARMVEEGLIEQRDDQVAVVDVSRVLVTRTLVRELEVDWSGVEIILRLLKRLEAAQDRIAELER